MQRQLTEAVKISRKPNEENLNGKNEYHGQRLRRLNIDQDEERNKIHCDVCGALFCSSGNLEDHNERFHRQMKCKQCEYTSFGNVDLKYHKQYKHGEDVANVESNSSRDPA